MFSRRHRIYGCALWAWLLAPLVMLATVCAAQSQSQSPPPAEASRPWERLSDGRVVIEVKGKKVFLPSEGSELDDIKFHPTRYTPAYPLRDILPATGAAREFLWTTGVVYIEIPNVERPGLFLGRFDRKDLKNVKFSLAIGESGQSNCRAWTNDYDRYRAQINSESKSDENYGWFEFKTPIPTWIYIRAHQSPICR